MRYGKWLLVAFMMACAVPAMAQQATTEQVIVTGTGTTYLGSYPDQYVQTGAITSATTTPIITGSATKPLYLHYLAVQVTLNTTGGSVNFEYGGGATCGTSTVTILPAAVNYSSPGVAPFWVFGWTAQGTSATTIAYQSGIMPSEIPFVIPAGNNVCILTSGGTTYSLTGVAAYAIH